MLVSRSGDLELPEILKPGSDIQSNNGAMVNSARIYLTGLLVVTLILAGGCHGGGSTIQRQPHADFDSEAVDAFLAAVGDGRYGDLHSTLVIIDGVTVLEAYFDGHRADQRVPLYSVTKSVLSALIGLATEDGAISSIDTSIFVFFPEHQGLALEDPRKLKITIGHLLAMTAGFEWDELSTPYDDHRNDYRRYLASDDRISFTLALPLRFSPGEQVTYCSPLSQVLSFVLTRATGMSAAAYAEARLFGPLGIDDWWWAAHDRHTSVGEAGLYLRPRDMAKLGQLYLQGGRWQGRQIVSSVWVDASVTAYGTVNQWNDYGYNWWLYNDAAKQHHLHGHDDIFYAVGRGGQFVWVLPGANAVIACTGWNDNTGRWPESMLWDFFLPAIDR
jgi:CubicO group peptidase (beta-lactamase class C family)